MPNALPLQDHPRRAALAAELHARPFPTAASPGQAVYLALKPTENAAGRDRAADWDYLLELLDHFGAPHPPPGATHHSCQLGRATLKWECHTEFVTYTLILPGLPARPFAPEAFEMFPPKWLSHAPAPRLTSAILTILPMQDEAEILANAEDWFVPQSVAIARVQEGELVIAGDFRFDSAGHMRFALFSAESCSPRRIGRILQQLCEIETYKAIAMLGLTRARRMEGEMGAVETQLSELVAEMGGTLSPEETLGALLMVSAELERLIAASSFRFGATAAYAAIVHERIAALREERLGGRQSFGDFMTRRFDPAVRTAASAAARLDAMAARAGRAAELLRTRVDVERSAQNQRLLESMDRRSDLALRLQHTVEGLSVVAISYYALGLASYLAAPAAEAADVPKPLLMAALVPVVVGVVYLAIRRIRRRMET
ncbi:DUF3422 family protein [Pseudoroseicyclus sp. H15]